MADLQLQVSPRSVLGKKVRAMRRVGLVPANVYGRGLQSESVQVDLLSLTHLLRAGGRNVVVQLQVEGEESPRPVIVRGVQRHPTTDQVLHVDFYQVSLTEKIRTEVPIAFLGVAPAAVDLGGTMLHSLDRVSVEALPTDVPPSIEVDVTILVGFDDAIHVRDLVVDPKVHIMTDPDVVVAKVAPPRLVAEVEEVEAAEEVPEEGAAAAGGEEAPEEEAAEEE